MKRPVGISAEVEVAMFVERLSREGLEERKLPAPARIEVDPSDPATKGPGEAGWQPTPKRGERCEWPGCGEQATHRESCPCGKSHAYCDRHGVGGA